MSEINRTKVSKLMALMLRHRPEKFGLKLTKDGWCQTASLVKALEKELNLVIGRKVLEIIVKEDKKGRYSFSMGNVSIRANQGHSTEKVEIEFKETKPPKTLFHGTNHKAFGMISMEGLKKMDRHHVHLTEDFCTAVETGGRRGRAHIIIVEALKMYEDGIKFYKSENDVWLTDSVKKNYFRSTWVKTGRTK